MEPTKQSAPRLAMHWSIGPDGRLMCQWQKVPGDQVVPASIELAIAS